MLTTREKRLIALMDMKTFIYEESGHRWISDDGDGHLNRILQQKGVALNNKIYGGWDEALDAVDLALNTAGQRMLEEEFDYLYTEDDITNRSRHLENRVDAFVKRGGLV